jgi:hypothetical protein
MCLSGTRRVKLLGILTTLGGSDPKPEAKLKDASKIMKVGCHIMVALKK